MVGDRGNDGGFLPQLSGRRMADGGVPGLGQLRRRPELHDLAAQRGLTELPCGPRIRQSPLALRRFGLADKTEIEFSYGGHSINGQGTFDFLHRYLN